MWIEENPYLRIIEGKWEECDMGWIKNGLLLATGGVLGVMLGGILYEQCFDDRDYSDDDGPEPDGLELLVKKIRREAEAAMAECETDEEREAAYAEIRASIEKIKEKLQKKGDAIIAELQEQKRSDDAKAEASAKAKEQAESIKETLEKAGVSLDEVLDSLKPKKNNGFAFA